VAHERLEGPEAAGVILDDGVGPAVGVAGIGDQRRIVGRAEVNPFGDGGDLIFGKLLFPIGHFGVFFVGDEPPHVAVARFSRYDGRSLRATAQQSLASRQIEARLHLSPPMAFDAALDEDLADTTFEEVEPFLHFLGVGGIELHLGIGPGFFASGQRRHCDGQNGEEPWMKRRWNTEGRRHRKEWGGVGLVGGNNTVL
jgi:hypothetical protein